MTRQDYQTAINSFEPDVYMKRRIAARIEGEGRHGRTGRRALAAVLAAAVVLVCTMGIALAASPELRQAVLTFLRLEEAEQVPGPGDTAADPADTPLVLETEVGGQVKAQYIQWDGAYPGSVTLEELGDGWVIHTWNVEDGVVSERTVDAQETTFTAEWRGNVYDGAVYWGVQDGELLFSSEDGYDRDTETEWYVSAIPGRTDTALLYVSQGRQLDYEQYVLLLHLDTGEMEDILAGTGVERLEQVYSYVWSEDLGKLLVTCRAGNGIDGAETYYCDLTAGTLTTVEDLTGTEADYASFADSETLIVSSFTDTECSYWRYDLTTGQTVQVLDREKLYRWYDGDPCGVMVSGARYNVYVERSGQISVLDLKTGARTPVEGFVFHENGDFLSNSSNTKLLYWAADNAVEGLGVSELGVLDLEKGVFLSFDREGYDAVYEWSIGWFDDDRVSVQAHGLDGDTQYWYLYEF